MVETRTVHDLVCAGSLAVGRCHEKEEPMKGQTHRTSSVAGIVIYRSPMSEWREGGLYSCLEELSGSESDPIIHEGEWPEDAAKSEMLPDCEHIK